MTRLGFLGIRATEFCDAACAVGCVFELRVRDALNHAKRTSDATGISIQPEGPLKARPEAQAGCQGLNMDSVSVTIRPSGFKIFGAPTAVLIWSMGSVLGSFKGWFGSVSGQYVFL